MVFLAGRFREMVRAVPTTSPGQSAHTPHRQRLPSVAVGGGVCMPHSRGPEPVMLLLKKQGLAAGAEAGWDGSVGPRTGT